MKINFLNYQNHVLGWLLCEVLTDEMVNTLDGGLDVVLTINGIEADLLKSMDFLNSKLNDIELEAKKEALSEFGQSLIGIKNLIAQLEAQGIEI